MFFTETFGIKDVLVAAVTDSLRIANHPKIMIFMISFLKTLFTKTGDLPNSAHLLAVIAAIV